MYIHVFDGEMIGCTNCEQMTDTYSDTVLLLGLTLKFTLPILSY